MPEKVIVVIAAPQSDRPTKVSSAAGKTLYKIIKDKYPEVEAYLIPENETLHKNATIIQDYAKKGNVLFSYFGHGYKEKACGMIPPNCGKSKVGMVDSDNVKVLKNVICHATACWTSVVLGRLAEEIGVKAYLGSRSPCFVSFNLTEHMYMDDIIDVWTTFGIRLLEGDTFAKALKAMTDKSKKYEEYYIENREELMYGEYYATRFKKNSDILVPYGDLHATLR